MARRKMLSSPPLDLSFARAATIITPEHHEVCLILVGCGGTGSFLAGSLARLARVLIESGRKTNVAFIDPDRVEEKNLGRQNFAEAELGYFKAATLAARFSAAWGLEIQAVTTPFDHRMITLDWRTLTIIAGAVDNAAARRELAQTLTHNYRHEAPRIWWCDAGNFEEAGQVLLGSAVTHEDLKGAFITPGLCRALPSPALQHPELLEARPEERSGHHLSCAELALLNSQFLMVNQRVAAEAADFIARLTLGRGLRRYATYFNLPSGSARSRYITPEEVARDTGRREHYLLTNQKSSGTQN